MANTDEMLRLIVQYQQEGGDIPALQSGIQAMCNSDKTSLGLNQWQLTDKPRMEDFNRDNQILNEKLVELQKNKVDMGETGTWTPRIYGETTEGDPVYTIREGSFYTVGGLIVCRGSITLSSKGGMEGYLRIDGLPANTRLTVACAIEGSGGLLLASGQVFTGFVLTGDHARLRFQSNTGGGRITADMITDHFKATHFTFIYVSE